MRIHTKIVFDCDGNVLEDEYYDYSGPLMLCDRSLTNQAQQAETTAAQTAGQYGAQAGAQGAFLTPKLEQWTVNPPGYSPTDQATMMTQQQLAGAASSGSQQEQAKLRAMRTGNVAGLGAQEAASAQGGARAAGQGVQSILAQNALLKAKQQQQALRELGNLYGTNVRGQTAAENIEPEDINAATKAQQSGWLQNVLNTMNTVANLGKAAGSMGIRL